VIWVSTWFDPPKETEAAKTLINGKADVLLQNTDSTAVLQEAERQGKYAFGWDSDMSAFAPKAHLGSCMLLWGVYYEKALNDVLNKTWKTGATKWGHKEGMTDFIKIPDIVPADARKKVEEAKAGLKAGTLDIFKGPIFDNTGKERLKKGVAADDEWLGKVDFLVKGVEGKVPASK
jgi:simple sugar transport system substrate-binding protein